MRKIVILFLLILSSCYLYAQNSGFLVHDSDTLQVILSVKKKKSEIKLFYRRPHEQEAHEITAENAESAFIPGKWKYISVNLPSSKDKVWTKCYFDGSYKLVKYQSAFYIIGPNSTYLLEESQKNTRIQKYKGQMTALFSREVPYEYNKLNYESKSLTEPLILYHKKKHIPYTDYNKYVYKTSSTHIHAGVTQTQGKLNLNILSKHDMEGYGGGIGIERIYTFPNFSEKLSFSVGAKFNTYKFDYYAKNITSRSVTYVDFNNTIFTAGGQGSILFHMLKTQKLNLSIQAGIEVLKPFGAETNVRQERVVGNTVNTSQTDISTYDLALISQFDQLVISLPQLSKYLAVGIGGSFPINKPQEVWNVFSVGNSYNISIYYQF